MSRQRDFSYYEAHAANVSSDDITSSDKNKRTLQRLRDGHIQSIGIGENFYWDFVVSEGDDLGWLGYFIGKSKSLRKLTIEVWSEDVIHALSDGIARNQSIKNVIVSELSSDGLAAVARTLGNLTQLEELRLEAPDDIDPLGARRPISNCVALGNLLLSGIRLKHLSLDGYFIGSAGMALLGRGLRSIGSSLEGLTLCDGSIGSEGLLTLAAALADCTSIKKLNLGGNDFSMAASGLGALSGWLQTAGIQLDELGLRDCGLNNEGLQALIEGAVNHCSYLVLASNRRITASGLRFLSTALQSKRCCLEKLNIGDMSIGDDTAELFARALVGNRTLRSLYLASGEDEEFDIPITPAGWSAFSEALCDTSSVNNTYNHSNHNFSEFLRDYYGQDIGYEDIPRNLARYLWLNRRYPQQAAKCKILMSHAHLDMSPFFKCELKFLPLAVDWFERAKPCTALSFGENPILEESDEVFQSRVLTALYQFVRGIPGKVLERRGEMTLVAAYDLEKKRLRKDVEERDVTIAQLKQRLREISQLAKS